ncbi:unnamed protein product [Caenorhabditis angaria]|uniref:Uncharacterized protein n=1 Tax=Caenorhabditis angaria TaxID=860376 RepID=A0A9P1MSE3_9PELO|nr:unnamed protein product [Caenorhabditis angaria]
MNLPPAPKKARRSEISRALNESVFCEDDEDEDSPFTMYFVRIPTVEEEFPTKEEENMHAELFRTVSDARIYPEWIDADDIFQLPQKSDFFVVPMFRGQIFRKLATEGYRVYGPPIVSECVEQEKPLPQCNHPVYSSVFEGVKVTCTGFLPEKRREIYEKIEWMNGTVSVNLYETITHLICVKADTRSEKFKVACRSEDIQLMRREWVDELWEETKIIMVKFSAIDENVENSYKLRIFEGLEMSLAGMEGADRSNTIKLIEENGGKVSGDLVKATCTHVITENLKHKKYLKAEKWGTIHIVQPRWVRKCVEIGRIIEESKYHPKLLIEANKDRIIRSTSTPTKENPVNLSADISSISGVGGKLNFSNSISLSQSVSSCTAIGRQQQQQSMTINEERIFERVTNSHLETPTRIVARQIASTSFFDPIDDLFLENDEDSDLFEGCMIWLCGVDPKKQDKWRRVLDRSGATRVQKIDSATHVVVLQPTAIEKSTIRKYSNQPDIFIVTAHWIVECFKKKDLVPWEEFEWNEAAGNETFTQEKVGGGGPPIVARMSRTPSVTTTLTAFTEEPAKQIKGLFSPLRFFLHSTLPSQIAQIYTEKLQENGGTIAKTVEDCDYVVFNHSAPINILLSFDAVVTYLYIDTCIKQSILLEVSFHPLFVPFPQPISPIFNAINFIIYMKNEFVTKYVKDMIEKNGGIVNEINNIQAREISYFIMMEQLDLSKPTKVPKAKMIDLSWIISSIAHCKRLPQNDFLFSGVPLKNFERSDDVWVKYTNEKENNATQVIRKANVEEEQVQEVVEENREELRTSHRIDLTKPIKPNWNLDGINEIIDEIPTPTGNESIDFSSITTTRMGEILRKAVENTGRRKEKEIEKKFLLSCSEMSTEERQKIRDIIGELKGIVVENHCAEVTHLICPKLNRTPKVLCTLASGKWCLTPDFIFDSQKAGKWIDEKEYEWTEEKVSKNAKIIEKQLAQRCRFWREKIDRMPINNIWMKSRQNGAFSDWKCVIHAEDKRALQILSILEAGGAQVFKIVEYSEIVALNPTHVFVTKDFEWNAQNAKKLKKESINLLIFDYIYEFLIDENASLEKFFRKF